MLCPTCHDEMPGAGPCARCSAPVERPTLLGAAGNGTALFCPHCGVQNAPGWNRCIFCGAASYEALRRRKWLARAAALMLALLALLALALENSSMAPHHPRPAMPRPDCIIYVQSSSYTETRDPATGSTTDVEVIRRSTGTVMISNGSSYTVVNGPGSTSVIATDASTGGR